MGGKRRSPVALEVVFFPRPFHQDILVILIQVFHRPVGTNHLSPYPHHEGQFIIHAHL